MHRTDVRRLPVDADLAAGDSSEAKDAARELGAPGAHKAIEPEDFALTQAQFDVAVTERSRERHEFENGLTCVKAANPDVGDALVAADHQRHQPLPGDVRDGLAGDGDLAITQHRHTVAKQEHLVELVADEDDRDALRPEPAQHVEQRRRLVIGDRGGRLVQKQDLCLERERLGDFDNLHLRDRERSHLGLRIDGAIKQVEDRAGLPVHLGVVDHCSSCWQVLEQDVLAHREARDEIALLVDSADRGQKRVTRRSEFHRLTVEQKASGVGLVDASHDLDKRRLSCAVLAHQRVNLSGADAKRDIVECTDARETLADVVDAEIHCATTPIGSGVRASD